MKSYIKRISDSEFQRKLNASGAVLIRGVSYTRTDGINVISLASLGV